MIFATVVLFLHLAAFPAAADADTTQPPPTTTVQARSAAQSDSAQVSDAKPRTRAIGAPTSGSGKPVLEANSVEPTSISSDSEASQALATIRLPGIESANPNRVILPETAPSRRKWIALSIVQHGAAAFDAYSTRQAISSGAHEDDPFLRPFAQSPAMYAAIQGGPVVLDFAARKMERSPNPLLRRAWWLPQSASTALFLFSGTHNLRGVHGARP